MYPRVLSKELGLLSRQFRIVTVLGPRQAGKSTLCRASFPDYAYVSLEDPDVRAYASTDPRGFLRDHPSPAIFDEIQRVPALLSYLQGIVDREKKKGQYILTGSHQLELGAAISQSLAGRTALLRLLPLSFEELPRGGRSAAQCVFEGGMPGRYADAVDVGRYYRSYFQTYVERDLRMLAQVKDLALFEKFVKLCAGRIAQVLNVASLAGDVGVSPNTAQHWLSMLEASFIVVRLPPFFENFGKRLVKSAKLYFTDSGLACWLLGINSFQQVARDPLWGALFENLVVTEALKSRHNRGLEADLYYFRDSHGHEVDLLLRQGRQLHAVEIKAAQTFDSSYLRGLGYFAGLVRDRLASRTVVYGGDQIRQGTSYSLLPFEDTHQIFGSAAVPPDEVPDT